MKINRIKIVFQALSDARNLGTGMTAEECQDLKELIDDSELTDSIEESALHPWQTEALQNIRRRYYRLDD